MGCARDKKLYKKRNIKKRYAQFKKKYIERKKSKKQCFKGNSQRGRKSHHNLTKKEKLTNLSLKKDSQFLNYNEIQILLNSLAKMHKSNLQIQVIGESKEHKPIYLVIINQNDSDFPRDAIFIEAGSNGGDFVAVASALYMIRYLAKKCACNEDIGNMDFFIIPCSNPDAYELSKSGKQPDLDLSSNFPFRLGNVNIDNIKLDKFLEAAEVWKKNYVFQCPERLAVIKAVTTYQFTIKLFVSLQEEGQKIVYPYGITEDPIPDIESIREVALAGKAGSFINCPVGSIYQVCGLKFGNVIDFLKMFQNSIKFPYIIHINDRKCKCDSIDISCRVEEILCCIKLMSAKVSEISKEDHIKDDDSNVTVSIKKEEPI